MKKILLVLAGGTICAFANDSHTREVDVSRARALLEENFRGSDSEFCSPQSTQFVVGKSFDTLSENMTVDIWNAVKSYLDAAPYDGFDGVIVAHGTDTLAYSASLFSMLYGGIGVPVIFVAANAPLDSEDSNGNANFRSAVECICRGICPNVYAVYRNSDGQTYLHAGAHLVQCASYSADFFSKDMVAIDPKTRLEEIPFCKRAKGAVDFRGVMLDRCVLRIEPYVGIDYSVYDTGKVKAVLHGAYHSGTVCTKSDDADSNIVSFVERCSARGVEVYVSPAKGLGDKGAEIYSSVLPIRDEVRFLYGMTKETAYAKLLIAYSAFDDPKKIADFLDSNVNSEYVY